MAYDTVYDLKLGAKAEVAITLDAGVGKTYTVSAGGTFQLTDINGNVITTPVNYSPPVAVTGYDTAAKRQPRIWYLLDTTGLADLAAVGSLYVGLFSFSALYSVDSTTQRLDRAVLVRVLPAAEGAVTFDVTTATGQTRLYCGDANLDSAIFTDAEIGQFLTDGGSNTLLAAALALDAICSNKALLSAAVKIGTWGDNESQVFANCAAQAARWRANAILVAVTNPPDQVFSTDTGGGTTPGSTSPW